VLDATAQPASSLIERVASLTGKRPVRWQRATRGYTPAERWVVSFADGSSAFVKAAATDDTATWLRAEHRVYAQVSAAFLPAMLAWEDDGHRPLLLLEDLSRAQWPPPWSKAKVEGVLETLAGLRRIPPPSGLPRLEISRQKLAGWVKVAFDPAPFLRLHVCSEYWLETALPALTAAEASAVLDGHEFVHFDIRSDNLCFADGRVIIVDWNGACRGNGRMDIAAWLPSLHAEGGPLPEEIMPDQPALAALMSGFFAARAGLPPPEGAPRVRAVQLTQLQVALPWAARALGLPPPAPPP
jgi:hypothetical protein